MADSVSKIVTDMKPETRGEYRIPRTALYDLDMDPDEAMDLIKERCVPRAIELGLFIQVDYDIDYNEIIFRWKPDRV